MEENFKNSNMKNPDVIINKSGKEFRTVKANENSTKANSNFIKNIFVPFICGMAGATVVIGTCFGVPNIRESLISSDNNISSQLTSSNATTNLENTSYISIHNYSDTAVAVAQKVLPSIVGIKVEYPVNSIFSMQSTTGSAEGSGIIISEDGYILTNNHVVSTASTHSYYSLGEANKVIVYLHDDKTEYTARVVGTDEETDLAVIKIDKTGLTPAELGDSDTVKVGEFAMAVGNPLGMKSSVTSGMISAINRDVTDDEGKVYTLTQTDAAINSGNSGGALVNGDGKVIGVNTLKVLGTGIEGMGFAIPINSAKPIYEELIQYNKVRRPYIGIGGRDINEKIATRYNLVPGIYVTAVEEFSGAERAGIRTGDVIVKVDGQEVKTMTELDNIKNKHQIGEEIKITINRDGKEKEVEVKLQEKP